MLSAKTVWLLILLTSSCMIIVGCESNQTARALTCYCNECPHADNCTTTEHSDSNCFKSIERQVEGGSYVWVERYGCLSGSDVGLASLQCHADNLKHTELQTVTCCQDSDFCNLELPDPDETKDPRWAISKPPQLEPDASTQSRSSLWPIILATVLLTLLGLLLFIVVYKLSALVYLQIKRSKKEESSSDTIESANSCLDEPIKNQFGDLHHNIADSISDSDRTYTISDNLSREIVSPYHYDNSYAPTEHTEAIGDVTSGVGSCILQQRTMARVIDMGTMVPVGCGRFGRVFKGIYNDNDVAVKAFQPIDYESWQREMKILGMLNHENIVRYIASETYTVGPEHATETWMFLEFCPYGSLCDFLDRNEILGPQQAIKILYSIIEGLNYLHEDYSTGGGKPPIAHRDIKSKNILMRTPEVCCLADFGHAVIKVNEESLDFGSYGCRRLQVGTVRYLAPEILKPTRALDTTQFHTFAQADLYQFGLVLWEICNRTALDVLHPGQSHRLPYDGVVPQNPNLTDMVKIVCDDNYRPPRSPHWERHPLMRVLSTLMDECWRANPKARMETLGVKKRIKALHNQSAVTSASMFYQHNPIDNVSPSANLKYDKSRIIDITL